MNNYKVGIFAYGSVIEDPRIEIIDNTITRIENIYTPFNVEFARSSGSRDGAPTLVPVIEGGANVKGVIFVMKEGVDVETAKDILWRRETGKVGLDKRYNPPQKPTENTVIVEALKNFYGVETVLYTKIASNTDVTPHNLAKLAIKSAQGEKGPERKDGISYLIDAKKNGIKTPIMSEYENNILKLTETDSLQQAYEKTIRK